MQEILESLAARSVRLEVRDGKLHAHAAPGAMTHELTQALSEHKEELIRYLSAAPAHRLTEEYPRITPDPDNTHVPFALNAVQHAYWIGRSSSLALGGTSTHVYLEFACDALDTPRLGAALAKVVARHGMLRAVVDVDGRQRILPQVVEYRIDEQDLSVSSEEQCAAGLQEIRTRMSQRVIPCEQWPLFEIRVVKLPAGQSRLCLGWDFLTVDAWSMLIVLREWHRFYVDDQFRPAPLTLSFRDYLLGEIRCRELPSYAQARQYWLDRVDDLAGPPSLPQSLARPGKRFTLRRRTLHLPRDLWSALNAHARAQGLTPSNLLLAAFSEVLARWSAKQRFCVNLTLFDRLPLHEEVASIVGDFTNLMLVEADLTAGGNFLERARRLQSQFLRDLDHRQFSAIDVMREIGRRRGAQHAAYPVVFTSTLALDGSRGEASSKLGVFGPLVNGLSQTPQVSLDCQIFDMAGELLVNWDAAEEIFAPGVLDDMFAAFSALLPALARDLDVWHQEHVVSLPPAQQQRRELANATAAPHVEECLHAAFVRHALSRPGRLAIECGDEALTYGELLANSDRLARQLIDKGVGPDQLVAVSGEKGAEQIVAALAIMIAGAAYLPLDSRWPPLRRNQVLADSGVRIVVGAAAGEGAADLPDGIEPLAVSLDRKLGVLTEAPALRQSPSDLAYVIFTSGSTGKPKGVMIDHRAALNTVVHINRLFAVDERDRMLAVSDLSFDLSVYDVFGILGAGAALVMPAATLSQDPAHWHALIRGAGITLWNSAPQLMSMLVGVANSLPDGRLGSLRTVLLSGDWIPTRLPDQVRALARGVQVVSLGGATEGAIWSIYFPIDRVDPDWKSIPYGIPLPNQHMYVLDARLLPCPEWVTGDIYIGGRGVALGYWNDAQKTARSFIVHPRSGERLYFTGDRGRYRDDGNVEFLGRDDTQVKVRGNRVELGEIAATLSAHPEVSEAIVRMIPGEQGAKLAAFVVPRAANPAPAPGTLRKFLEQRLPDHMVPLHYLLLERMPLTANGKVDEQSLLIPADTLSPPAPPTARASAPGSDTERSIWNAWAEVLGRQSLRIDDNFFEVGGDSVQLVEVMNRLNSLHQWSLSINDMLAHPTVQSLALHLEPAAEIGSVRPEATAPRSQVAEVRAIDVAIIGMAGRFPDAPDVEKLWENIAAKRCAVRQFTDPELLAAGVNPAEMAAPGYVKAGVVLPDVEQFDAGYFDVSPGEAAIMDPQQRLLLECAAAALDDAGYPTEKYGGRIGVFAGKGTNFYMYEHLVGNRDVALNADILAVLSLNEPDYAATLVSYKLGLTGPSLSINTACSTSLVAIHAACRTLTQSKDAEIALAGGVTVASTVNPSGYLRIEGHITSPDGYCRAFSDDANGCVFGSGVGLVVLKPLQRALEDGDTIHAVIKGSAINNDGSLKLGFTAPSARGQARVISDALQEAGCASDSIQLIEAHGTATNLGDPIEIEGLKTVFGGARDSGGRVAVGSVKTNIGHLGSAAGVAGLIKAVQALRHKQLPPTLHAAVVNRKIAFDDSPFQVNGELRDWPVPVGRRRAGVSSFGVGGTNAHVILEEAPDVSSRVAQPERSELLVLSARSRSALVQVARNLAATLRARDDLNLEDVAFTLQVGRKAHEWRCALVCPSRQDASRLLQADLVMNEYRHEHTPQVVFVLSGEGMSRVQAIRVLYQSSPDFHQAFDRCAAILRELGAGDLHELLNGGEANPRLARGLRFASEYSLASLWLGLGIKPSALLGRGSGEYVAACLAEVLSPGESLQLADAGAALPQTLPPPRIPLVHDGAEAGANGAILLDIAGIATAGGAQISYANLLEHIGRLWTQGVPVEWTQLHVARSPRRVPLPGYPFERGRHWIARSATNRVGPAALVMPRDAVHEAAVTGDAAVAAGTAALATSDDIQKLLRQIWAGVLGTQDFGINDNFFDLGGDSVMATRVFARVRDELGVELPIAKMFECATVRQMHLFVVAKRNPEMLDHFSEEELQEVLAMTEA